jgi:hypothetical protein
VDFAKDRGTQRMRLELRRFAIADQHLSTHRAISIPPMRSRPVPPRHD